MRVEDLKRWHWIVVGLLVGLALSYLYSSINPGTIGFGGQERSMGQEEFERLVRQSGPNPGLYNVVVYPPRGPVTIVTGYHVPRHARGQIQAPPFVYKTESPYEPLRGRGNIPPGWDELERPTVRDYLEYHAAENDNFSFTYAWTREPRYVYLIWTLASVLIIGGVWPTLVSLLTGAGLGRRSEPQPEYDLDRFQGGPEPDWQPAKKQVTQEDLDQLAAVEAELERKLAAGASDSPASIAQDETTDQPVRELEGGPLEQTAPQQPSEAAQAYGGEFYPTVAHAPKKKDG